MKTDKNVERYLIWIRRQLHGIERDSIDNIIEELEGHINEKAQDRAEEQGLKSPTEAVYQQVLEELGPPEIVAIDYLKILPKRPSSGIKAFLAGQAVIGIVAFLIGLGQLLLFADMIHSGDDANYPVIVLLTAFCFILLGVGTMTLAIMQLRRPGLIVHYGSGTVLLSLSLGAGILFVMLGFITWKYLGLDLNYETLNSFATPIFLGLTFAFMIGLKATEEFQRRLALEEVDNKQFESKRTTARNTMAAIIVVAIVLISGIGAAMFNYKDENTVGKNELVSTDTIGGPNNVKIEHWRVFSEYTGNWVGFEKVVYAMNGTNHEGSYQVEMKESLSWIKANTPSNATILCWWDYGHSIRALSERNTVVANPSTDQQGTIVEPYEQKEWDDPAKVQTVGKALVAESGNETAAIMKGAGARYLVTNQRDIQGITYAFYKAAGKDPNEYIKPYETPGNPYSVPTNPQPTDKGRTSTIFRLWLGSDVEGLNLVYSDLNTRIYEVDS